MKELHQVYKKENSEESGRWKKIPVVLQACRQSLSFLCVFHYQKMALEIHFNAWLIAMRRSQGKDKGDSRNLAILFKFTIPHRKFSLTKKKKHNKKSGDLVNRTKGNCTKWHVCNAIPQRRGWKKNGRQNLGTMWKFCNMSMYSVMRFVCFTFLFLKYFLKIRTFRST